VKDSKVPKKKSSRRKISLKVVRLNEVRFTTSSKGGDYPSIPISPRD